MIESLHSSYYCLQYSQWGVCVYVSQLAVTGIVEGNKSQRKLASSRCTLIHSILLSLCALFSPSPNTETLNLHTQIHWGPAVCIGARWNSQQDTRRAHSRTHAMHASCMGDTYWFVHGQTHTHTRTHPRMHAESLPRGLEA